MQSMRAALTLPESGAGPLPERVGERAGHPRSDPGRADATAGAPALGAAHVPFRERVLLIAPHSSYRTAPFVEAAHRLGVEILIASEGKHSLVSACARGLHIRLQETRAALDLILEEARARPFAGIIGTDDATTELAALAARHLGLRHNRPDAVRIARRKDLARGRLREAGVRVPPHRRIALDRPLAPQLARVRFPCVLKPVALAASRGVIRADDPAQLQRACARIARILASAERLGDEERCVLLAEDFIPGFEVAVEGMLNGGELEVLAVFDKPDPLDGPFFEETYYVTPSRLPVRTQEEIRRRVGDACAAYGLEEGPVHAECRVNGAGVWILEVAARTIGGLCARLLRFGTGYGLEELVLAHATRRPLALQRGEGAAGVLMIPISQAGILRRVEGLSAARDIPYVEEVDIQVREGYELVPLPEGASYLGFIFARAPTPEQAEAALRASHACLNVVVAPLWKAVLA
jgi:biotin carboxylase